MRLFFLLPAALRNERKAAEVKTAASLAGAVRMVGVAACRGSFCLNAEFTRTNNKFHLLESFIKFPGRTCPMFRCSDKPSMLESTDGIMLNRFR